MLWLAVHCPGLGLELCPPGDPDRPRVLVRDSRIVLCNPAATAAGISPGTTLATAHGIVHGLEHFQHNPDAEARRLQWLAELLSAFSAEVSLEPPTAILLEAGRSLDLFGPLDALEQRVAAQLGALGHETSIRSASTPLAALALARSRPLGIERLDAVPLACTELDERLVERFVNLGIRTLGPLLRLPADELARRFGPTLTGYLRRLTGDAPDPRVCITPAARYDGRLGLLEPLSDRNALLGPMTRLLHELEHWLVARQLAATRITWQFAAGGRRETPAALVPVRFARPRQDARAFLELSRMHLETAALPDEVLDIRLRVARPVPWEGVSHTLFEPLASDLPGQGIAAAASDLIDRLSARLGAGVLSSVSDTRQHGPEQAWQAIAPLAATKTARDSTPGPIAAGATRRPLWLFPNPCRVARQALTLLSGPERIQTGWWHGGEKHLDRDYYVARHANGACCWAFVDTDRQWYLHGYFG
jgi:protein ImuB